MRPKVQRVLVAIFMDRLENRRATRLCKSTQMRGCYWKMLKQFMLHGLGHGSGLAVHMQLCVDVAEIIVHRVKA